MGSDLLGVDIGGTKVALRRESVDGSTRDSGFTWPAASSAAEDLALLAHHVGAAAAGARIGTVGVALPTTLDADGRVTAWPSRPSWTGVDPLAALREALSAAAVVHADDGDLAALAEARALPCTDLVYVGVGTGVGGGLVVGGHLLPGPSRGSCELGHLVIDRSGPACACGRRGCVQAVASGPAVLRRAAHLRGGPVTREELGTGWAARESWAVAAVDDSALAVATAMVGVGELTRPEFGVVGGGFATGTAGYVDRVAEHVAALSRPGHPGPTVRAARLGALSSLQGAVELARLHAAT